MSVKGSSKDDSPVAPAPGSVPADSSTESKANPEGSAPSQPERGLPEHSTTSPAEVQPLPTSDAGQDGLTVQALCDLVVKSDPKADTRLIIRAYDFSHTAHLNQKRRSGEPFFNHPLGVAWILAEMKLDPTTIVTGLLHDTVEDTFVNADQIEDEFGSEIASLVDGVTKLSKITFKTSEEKQAENFRKMLLAMAKDLRVILVKLADRLHNMRTLEHMLPEKQVQIAQETLDIYCPLANRLGLNTIKREMEDLALRFTKPEVYYRLAAHVAKRRQERDQYIHDVQKLIQTALHDHGYTRASLSGRPKHLYSIHRKMEKRNLSYDQIFDITGFRILVDTVEECYGTLGLIHSLWTPVPGRFKDYIAIPKANFYQSLHTTVIGPQGERIEIQIRTKHMHETAERGIAAHWAYKEGKEGAQNQKDLERFRWLSRLVEFNKDLTDPNEFLESVKLDLFSEDVYVFTPKGQVMEFPQGSTPLDFAYAIHTDLGHHCIGAKVNSRMVPLKHKLKSGDTVEILTSPNQKPNKDWLKTVKTSRARNKIRSYVKAEQYERSQALGETILERELKRVGMKVKPLLQNGTLKKVAESFSFKTAEDLLSGIGYGRITATKVVSRIAPKTKEGTAEEPESQLGKLIEMARTRSPEQHAIRIKGVEDLLVRFARCCNPIPGDPIVGFVTRGRGISVHSRNCPKIFESDPHRLIEIEWEPDQDAQRSAKFRVVCEDRSGLLADLSKVIRDNNANITRAQIGTTRDRKAVCLFTITIANLKQLTKIMATMEGIPGVLSVQRLQKKSS